MAQSYVTIRQTPKNCGEANSSSKCETRVYQAS